MKRKHQAILIAGLFLLPNLAGFVLFTAGPVLFSAIASFSNWNLMQTVPFQWIGFDNYIKLITSEEFWLFFINTVYLMLGIPLSIAGSLFLAVMLSQRVRGLLVYRTLFYLPSFTAGVAMLILWKALYNPNFGPVNYIIEQMLYPLRAYVDLAAQCWLVAGEHPGGLLAALVDPPTWVNVLWVEPPLWLTSTKNMLGLAVEEVALTPSQFGLGARDAIVIMGIWTTMGGANMLLYLAGIANIPPELYEAAEIDGAGRWAQFRHVTWPQLAPTTFFIVIMSVITGLQGGFEQARVMTLGGPAGTTTTLSFYIYMKGFEEFQMGYASAVAWLLFAIVFAITLVNWRYGSRHVNY
jgi:multiple sugar transport system permease protein